MPIKPVFIRGAAHEDIKAGSNLYLCESGVDLALDFVTQIERAIAAIQRQPRIGSPRYAEALGLPGVRHRLVQRFPFLIFYREDVRQIDIWRVLHAHRDIPRHLQGNT